MKLRHYIVALLILAIAGLWAYTAVASSVGPNSPGTMADDATVGTLAWSNVDNAKTSNDVYATRANSGGEGTVFTHYLKATNFGFTIPTGATIDGIVIEMEKHRGTGTIKDVNVKMVKSDGTIGATNKADTATNWNPTTDVTASYGSSSDLWGETWAYTDINDVDFGVVLSASLNSNPGPTTASVDHIRTTIFYTDAVTGSPQIQIRSGVIDVKSGKIIVQ